MSVLYGICKEVRLYRGNSKDFASNITTYWDMFLKTRKLNKKYKNGINKMFTGTIQTDGVVLCTHFQRPKNTQDAFNDNNLEMEEGNSSKKQVLVDENDVIGAIDPGRVIIYNTVVRDIDGTLKSYKLKREQYYNDTGIYEARKKASTWNNSIKATLTSLSNVSSKGVAFERYLSFIGNYFEEYDSMWNEYLKPRWSRQRFRLYCAKKRVFARYFNAIKNDYPSSRRIVMAYGSAKFAAGSKNEISVPTTTAFKECQYRFPTIVVDEFRTSKIHHENDAILQLVRVKGSNYPLRGLLWCPVSNKFVGRDYNASLNILRCAIEETRPQALTRIEGLPRIRQHVGKTVKKRNISKSPKELY